MEPILRPFGNRGDLVSEKIAVVAELVSSVDQLAWQRIYSAASLFITQHDSLVEIDGVRNCLVGGLEKALENLRSVVDSSNCTMMMRIHQVEILLAKLGSRSEERCLKLSTDPSVDVITRLTSARILVEIGGENANKSLSGVLELPRGIVPIYTASLLALRGSDTGVSYLIDIMREIPKPSGWLSSVVLLSGLNCKEALETLSNSLSEDTSEDFAKKVRGHVENLVSMYPEVETNIKHFLSHASKQTDKEE